MKFSKIIKRASIALATTLGVISIATIGANASSYTVQSGDSLWSISQKYNVSIDSLLTNNPSKLTSTSSTIFPNEVLTINQYSNQASTNESSYSYQQPTRSTGTTNYASQANTVTRTDNSNYSNSNNSNSNSSANSSAANQIAQAESGGSYTAQNGQYYGKYQLDTSYLHGDYSPANQDRVFVKYCNQRYGSVNNALSFRESHGWY